MNKVVIKLFNMGVQKFNSRKFYDAHEYFEEIWLEHYVTDRLFIQSLIQLSVAYFHISNLNKNGSIGLFKKAIKKLDLYKNNTSIIENIDEVIHFAHLSLANVESIDDICKFDWKLAPKITLNEN